MSKPTIHEVAARAGVSKSLVSLVMRDSPNVSDDRREAVLRAALELAYRPNAVARSLVEGRTRAIGVMVSDLHNPFFAEVMDGIDAQASQAGYRALINSGHRLPEREQEAIETFLELRADGLIVAGPALPPDAIVEASRWVPVVVVGRRMRTIEVDSVADDDEAGARMAVEHLAGLGHRHIVCISGGQGAGAAPRRQGYEEAMHRLGLAEHSRVVEGAFTEDGGYRAMRQILDEGIAVTGVCAPNDLGAIGAMEAIEEDGLRVPEDVSIVGYDNTRLAQLRHIALTTVHQPRFEIGAAAVRLVLERLEEGRTEARRLVLPPSLVVRSTTGPPGR